MRPVFCRKERGIPRVPLWLSRLRIWWCHCCGTGLIPGLETSPCRSGGPPPGQKKEKRKEQKWPEGQKDQWCSRRRTPQGCKRERAVLCDKTSPPL